MSVGSGRQSDSVWAHPQSEMGRTELEKKLALRWELVGVVFITLLGAVLHFAFEWSGYWDPVAIFAAVNESTWEHFKIAFWPGLLFALIEYPWLRRSARSYWPARSLGLLTVPFVIGILFYSYTAMLGRHELSLDIIIFVIAVAAGQLVSYRTLTLGGLGATPSRLLGAVLALMIAAYSLLSYFAPACFLFEDPETGGYGILEEYGGHDHDDDPTADSQEGDAHDDDGDADHE
jgi:hypothetical protein